MTSYCSNCKKNPDSLCWINHPHDISPFRPGEFDPRGIDRSIPGAKLDADKEPVFEGLFDYFPDALLEVARVSGQGAIKYKGFGGWRQVPDKEKRYNNALGRHLLKRRKSKRGPDGLRHAAQIAWNALMLLQTELEEEQNGTAPFDQNR